GLTSAVMSPGAPAPARLADEIRMIFIDFHIIYDFVPFGFRHRLYRDLLFAVAQNPVTHAHLAGRRPAFADDPEWVLRGRADRSAIDGDLENECRGPQRVENTPCH